MFEPNDGRSPTPNPRKACVAAFAFFMALPAMVSCVEPEATLDDEWVAGQVSIDGDPAAGVRIEILEHDSPTPLVVGTTDLDGAFHLDTDAAEGLVLRVVTPTVVHEQLVETNTETSIEIDLAAVHSEPAPDDPNQAGEATGLESLAGGGIEAPTRDVEVLSQSFVDWSGDVTITIYSASATTSSIISDFAVPVAHDEVLIGGGARIVSHVGKSTFLSANYPNAQSNAWVASAKPHIYWDNYTLYVYSIGLKLNGVSAATLRNYVDYHDKRLKGNYARPPFWFGRRANHDTLCGGIRVDSPNHLLFENYYDPNTQIWHVRAKSHGITSYSDATGYQISISRDFIPGFGYLDVGSAQGYTGHFGGGQLGVAAAYVPNGSVLACPGAHVEYWPGAGRLLTNISPSGGNAVTVADKDLQYTSSGTLQASATYIRKRP